MTEPNAGAPEGANASDDSAPVIAAGADARTDAPPAESPAPGDQGTTSELAPLIPTRGTRKARGKGKRRKGSRRAKGPGKAALDRIAKVAGEKRDQEEATRRASAIADAPAATPAPDALASSSASPAELAPEVQGVPDASLVKLVGLTAHLVAKAVPPKYGGGQLTEDERDMLGSVWAEVVKPYVQGEGAPLMLAIAATVQVFALRALAYVPPAVEPVTHSRAASSGSPSSEAPAPAPASGKAKAVTPPAGGQYDKEEAEGR